ncbi:MAG: zf-HC2 domain-containing protein [Candidatus Aminicenantes bacterium]|nr:zf-HC2 domain-containing protein [Candidatus Aminicenantes bacterium]
MRCKKYREQIVLYLYGDLSETERADLESHINGCRRCAQELASTKHMFRLLDETKEESIPEADWEKCWSTVREVITAGKKIEKRNKPFMFPKWVYAGASLVVIFVLGIAIGRLWLSSDSSKVVTASGRQTSVSSDYVRQSLNDHFENLKPLLVEYANYSSEGNGDEPVSLDRGIVESLLIQNYLLKKIVAESNPSAQQILDDLDLVLREIKNRRSDDTSSSSLIKNLIRERDILFHMDVLETI